jgi:dienelactone hydrolase
MKNDSVQYQDGDVTLQGFLAYDDTVSGKRPGVLVMPEAFGLGPHAKQRAERIAQMGYVALAGDPYGNGITAKDLQEAMQQAGPLRDDPVKFRQRGRVALEKLASLPQVDTSRLAAIGYCMGGTFALELARDGAALRGVVSFHGGLETKRPAASGGIKRKCWSVLALPILSCRWHRSTLSPKR